MTKKQQKAMIERKKAEVEKKKAIELENKSAEVEQEDEDLVDQNLEVITLLSGVDFEIGYCVDQETITDKILYLAEQEKNVLSKFKDKDQILKNGIYRELYDTVIDVFGHYLTILRNRLDLIIKSEKLHATMNHLQFKVGDLKQDKINNKFEVRLLRYKNWLYFWQKLREHKIERRQAKLEYKAKIKELKKQLKEGVVMSP